MFNKQFITLILFLSFFNILMTCNNKKLGKNSERIRINQLGYYLKSPKKFIVVDTKSKEFQIIEIKTDKAVYNGKLIDADSWTATNETAKIGDFTDFNKQGDYKILIKDIGYSYIFKIDNNIFDEVLKSSMKSYYYQRASIDLDKKYADKWARKKGHPDNKCQFHYSTKRTGFYSSPGGWYDAGDYGKYIVNGGITVCTLLSFYELFPNVIDDDLNIPESNNDISDLLDELKYEIDWMKTMQDNDGGVFFKIGPLKWPGFVMPEDDKDQRYIIGKSTTSTLNFCAVMAQAGRVFKNINPDYANDCVKRAVRAWEWAVKNPNESVPSETGGTGAYGDNSYADEFCCAAAELLVTTNDKIYKNYLEKNINIKINGPAWWQNLQNLSYFTLSIHKNNVDPVILKEIKNEIISFGNILIKRINENQYRIPMKNNNFEWGSNGVILNYGIILSYSYILTKDIKYLNASVEIIDYIFGKNATGYSFVTGYGDNTPMKPHHRPMAADNIREPIPGFIVGGPNKDKQDKLAYKSNFAAKSYLDVQGSYASNEICINWNAPLVFMLGFLEANKDKLN